MTLTQRLAPMLVWAAECTARGMHSETRELTLVYAALTTEPLPVLEVAAWATRYYRSFGGCNLRGWTYAMAYVLLLGDEL